jgi:hypothetical protein
LGALNRALFFTLVCFKDQNKEGKAKKHFYKLTGAIDDKLREDDFKAKAI